jgi:hypothetical protein
MSARGWPRVLWREVWQDKQFDVYRNEIAAIRAGAIDGYAVDELQQFLPDKSPPGHADWRESRKLLSKLFESDRPFRQLRIVVR